MSNVSNTTGVSGTRKYDENASRAPNNNLGKDEFMQILASQLSNQDPLEPMKDTEFIAQMAQFTALEQMTALNASFELSQAYAMVGKMVTAEPTIDGFKEEVFGLVDYVYTRDGVNYLQIGDTSVPMAAVTGVADPSQYNGVNSQLSELLLNSGNLIGKTVTALVESEESETGYTTVTGVVERVFIDDQKMICATVDGTTVRLNMLTQIAETEAAD